MLTSTPHDHPPRWQTFTVTGTSLVQGKRGSPTTSPAILWLVLSSSTNTQFNPNTFYFLTPTTHLSAGFPHAFPTSVHESTPSNVPGRTIQLPAKPSLCVAGSRSLAAAAFESGTFDICRPPTWMDRARESSSGSHSYLVLYPGLLAHGPSPTLERLVFSWDVEECTRIADLITVHAGADMADLKFVALYSVAQNVSRAQQRSLRQHCAVPHSRGGRRLR